MLFRSVFDLLNENVLVNQLKDVTVYNKAVSNKEGKLSFYYDQNQLGTICGQKQGEVLKVSEVVDTVLLSDYISEEVDFMKIDIEGAEEDVLNELVQKGKLKMIKEMVIEYHHHIDPNLDRFSQILTLLEKQGFGYQMNTNFSPFTMPKTFQDILIFAYRKN